MKTMRTVTLCAILTFTFLQTRAQHVHNQDDAEKNVSGFKLGLRYLSNDVYNGRKDSLPVPYLTPSFGYYNRSGFYINSEFSFLLSSYSKQLDLVTIEAGYEHSIGDKLYFYSSVSKYVFNSSSVSVRSAISADLNAGLSYEVGNLFSVDLGSSAIVNTGPTDIFINLGLSKSVSLGEQGKWRIEPAAMVNAGTRYYHDQYLQSRNGKINMRRMKPASALVSLPGTTVTSTYDISTLEPGKISMLDMELAAPVYYESGRWSFFVKPMYAIPFNPSTYIVTQTTTVQKNNNTNKSQQITSQKEGLSNSFYFQVGGVFRL